MTEKQERLLQQTAEAAVEHAQFVRAAHAKRSQRGSTVREADIARALERLKRAMLPIRSELARLPSALKRDPSDALAAWQILLRELSKQIQCERRKLWKMQQPKRTRRSTRAKR